MSSILEVIDDIQEKENVDTNTEVTKEEVATETTKDIFDIIEEVSTEAVQIERKGNKVPSLANLEVVMDETMEELAKHIAAYAKTLEGSDYYEYIRNIDIIDSDPVKWLSENVDFKEFEILDGVPLVLGECVWDPDHGVAVNLKTFEVALLYQICIKWN